MEANNNMTAERSLEIITAQIAQSRKDVSKDVGLSLYIAGLCTMGTAIIIGTCTLLTNNGLFYLLYFALPFVIWGVPTMLSGIRLPSPPASLVRWLQRRGSRSPSSHYHSSSLPTYSTIWWLVHRPPMSLSDS